MEKDYKSQLAYLDFLRDEITEQLPELDIIEVENRIKQYCDSLNKLDEIKNMYVEECLKSDIERNQTLEWVTQQKPVFKSLTELKSVLDETLRGLKTTVYQNSLKERQNLENDKTQLAIESERRLAEARQKFNVAVNDDLTKLTMERHDTDKEFHDKNVELRNNGSATSVKPTVRLQKLSLTPFSGDVTDYVRFSAQFETEIDKTNLDEITKLNYLLSLTKGKPRDDISGLPHNIDGYKMAKSILQQKYGKDSVVFKTLVLELENLPSIRYVYQKREINDFSQRFSKIVRTLTTMGKISSVDGNVHSVFSRLGPLRENLAATNDDWESWSLTKLAEELEKYVDRNNLSGKWSNDYKSDKNSQSERHKQLDRRGQSNRNNQYDRDKSTMFYNNGDNKDMDIKNRCVFCNYTNHQAKDCLKVLDLAKRREIVQSKKLCYVCLREGHMANKCKAKRCEKCDRSHHVAVCDRSEKTSIPVRDFSEKSMGMLQKLGSIHPTALVEVNGIPARILFDTGSSSSYICTDILTRLGEKPVRSEFKVIEQLYKGIVKRKVEIYKIKIKSRILDYEINVEVGNTGKDILTFLQNYDISRLKRKYPRIKNLMFSDEHEKGEKLPVHIILGARDFNKMKIPEPPIILKDNDLVVEMTKLGWIISGGGHISPSYDENTFFLSSEAQFDSMTKIDLLGISDATENNADFHEKFMEKLVQNENGRYVAPLPWKRDVIELPHNKEIALNRLHKNTNRLVKLNKLSEYDDIMREQIETGVLEKVPKCDSLGRVHYIPHQAVIKESSESTKLRVVYDCSAKLRTGEPSLNDCLECGPPLQPHLFDILMRIRSYKFLITGDICKAFHQICLVNKDIDAQRLFWYSDLPNRVIEEYRFTRVIFGCNSSPYILGATLQKHFNKYKDRYPETIESLLANTYVDDILAGGSLISDLEKFKRESISIMGDAQMELHKWHSNARSLELENGSDSMINITPDDQEESQKAKILGMSWDKTQDTISINLWGKEANETKITKRNILSFVHSIYDLLGLASPVTILGKVIFSKTCLQKLRWDQQVPEDIAQDWIKYVHQLKRYPVITFPRYIMTNRATDIEMHGFSDASFTAICAMVYIVWNEDNTTKSFLLVSKCRVAPKETSVPRLELIGALMLSRLMHHCKGNLQNFAFSRIVAWTDSTTVLCWLQSKGTYSRYVRNRVDKIKEMPLKWLHCPTADNPADIGSRGCYPNKIGDIWFYGPKWIGDNDKWPEQPQIVESIDSELELSKQRDKEIVMMEVACDKEGPLHFLLNKPYMKMLRITAYVFRFFRRAQGEDSLSTEEIENSEMFWIKYAQRSINIDEEQNNLENRDGIYYIAGRILGYNPILIPRVHPLAKSLVINAHKKTLHGGASTIMAHIRKRFWIPQLRVLAKSVVHSCEKCKRYRVKPLAPPKTGKMPVFRTEFSPPFTVVGVDFAGPILYKLGQNDNHIPGNNKCYIALFTCATTRAVYLKLCKSQTQEEFQHILKEFVTRRGIPKTIVSDNAKTFHATSEWLKLIKTDKDLNNFVIREGIKWKFNMSRAPWWGGFFERLIGITKRALSKSIGKGFLSFQELENVLFDIENFMNNRPLTYQGEELEKPALTPNMFLRGNDSVSMEEDLDKLVENIDITRRLAHIERCKNKLRYRWLDEYLHALQERHKIKSGESEGQPTIGAIVLLKEDVKDKAQWRIARVTKELKGKDEQIRGYELKLGNGYTIQRPVQLVCPLELQAEVKEDLEAKVSIQPERDRPERSAKDIAKAKIQIMSENEDYHMI